MMHITLAYENSYHNKIRLASDIESTAYTTS
jgi:hypothetical protein